MLNKFGTGLRSITSGTSLQHLAIIPNLVENGYALGAKGHSMLPGSPRSLLRTMSGFYCQPITR